MAASLRAGVAALGAAGCDWVLVTLGDQPRVTSRVIAAVAHAASRARFGTRPSARPTTACPATPSRWGGRCSPAVAELRGDAGRPRAARRATVLVRELEVGRLADPVDVDTPEELEEMRT